MVMALRPLRSYFEDIGGLAAPAVRACVFSLRRIATCKRTGAAPSRGIQLAPFCLFGGLVAGCPPDCAQEVAGMLPWRRGCDAGGSASIAALRAAAALLLLSLAGDANQSRNGIVENFNRSQRKLF